MYNGLDSRALGRLDCYGQRFMRPGDYCYDIVPAHGHAISTHRPYLVRVRPGDGDSEMKQHDVRVTAARSGFSPSDPELAVDVGDLVLWNCSDGDLPFAVVGDHDFFGSHRLVNECGFSHVFGSEGEFHWVDAYGGGACGTVRVRRPDCTTEAGLKRWQEVLAEGSLVMIADDRATPCEVDIVVGQTVFFAVVKSGGISITDKRLLLVDRHAEGGDGGDCAESVSVASSSRARQAR
jgi:plastocyanin